MGVRRSNKGVNGAAEVNFAWLIGVFGGGPVMLTLGVASHYLLATEGPWLN